MKCLIIIKLDEYLKLIIIIFMNTEVDDEINRYMFINTYII